MHKKRNGKKGKIDFYDHPQILGITVKLTAGEYLNFQILSNFVQGVFGYADFDNKLGQSEN